LQSASPHESPPLLIDRGAEIDAQDGRRRDAPFSKPSENASMISLLCCSKQLQIRFSKRRGVSPLEGCRRQAPGGYNPHPARDCQERPEELLSAAVRKNFQTLSKMLLASA